MAEDNTDQAPEQSAEDAIYAKFSRPEEKQEAQPEVEGSDNPDAEEVPAEDEFEEVEYEGARYQVPKPLKKAILQEADYTRKTQEVASQRQLLEQTQANMKLARMEHEFHQAKASEFRQLKNMEDWVQQLDSVDYNQMDSDAIVRHLATIQKAKAGYAELSKKLESDFNNFKSEYTAAISEAKAKSREFLSKNIPGFTEKALGELREYGLKAGFTEAIMDSIEADPKAALWGYKAMKWDQLQNDKSAAVKKLGSPAIKPSSSNPMSQAVKEKLSFNKAMKSAKTSQEKAKLIEQRLAQTM